MASHLLSAVTQRTPALAAGEQLKDAEPQGLNYILQIASAMAEEQGAAVVALGDREGV
jgi:hypothetical protein